MKDTEQSPTGAEKFLTVPEVASILSVRPSTVYQWASSGEIPHYRLGRIMRFKRKDLEVWVEGFRKERIDHRRKTREILSSTGKETQDIERIIEKSIAEVKGNRYTSSLEKPGKDKGLRKEAEYGLVS
ncbi:MAG: helix-turn-helix domain-containing protein [Thermodesulfobacteriota bacterium]